MSIDYYADDLLRGREDVGIVHLDAWAAKCGVQGYVPTSRGLDLLERTSLPIKYVVLHPEYEHLVLVRIDAIQRRVVVYDSYPDDYYHDSTLALVLHVAEKLGVELDGRVTWAADVPHQAHGSRTCGYHVARFLATVPFGLPLKTPLPKRTELNEALVAYGRLVTLT